MGGTFFFFFGFLMVAGPVLLLAVAVRVIAGGVGRRDSAGPDGAVGDARRILDERYARGDLTTEEYRDRLRVLTGGA